MNKSDLRSYARLIVRVGANVQKGQDVEIFAGVNDEYFVKTPSEEDLKVAYADIIDLKKNAPKETEKFTGVAGFFANIFGIILVNNDKAKRIAAQEEDATQIEEYEPKLKSNRKDKFDDTLMHKNNHYRRLL